MRHDLAGRAEPRQIERLSVEVAALSARSESFARTRSDGRISPSLKAALEKVCGALAEASRGRRPTTFPTRSAGSATSSMPSRARPEPEPADLEPIAAQLTLTDRPHGLPSDRSAVRRQRGRSGAVRSPVVPDRQRPCRPPRMRAAPLWERFDKLESRAFGRSANGPTRRAETARSLASRQAATRRRPRFRSKPSGMKRRRSPRRGSQSRHPREPRTASASRPGDGGSLDHRPSRN